jgi:hypothetical protein
MATVRVERPVFAVCTNRHDGKKAVKNMFNRCVLLGGLFAVLSVVGGACDGLRGKGGTGATGGRTTNGGAGVATGGSVGTGTGGQVATGSGGQGAGVVNTGGSSGTCVPGATCTPSNSCHEGETVCTGGVSSCNDTQHVKEN